MHSNLPHPSLPGLEPAARVRVAFLGSGSSGNATALAFGPTLLLLDCGFSAKETKRRLEAAGLGDRPISGIFLTHEHADHVAGARVLAKRGGMPVYASAGTWASRRLGDDFVGDRRELRAGESLRIGDVNVRTFTGSHDTPEPIGYVFEGEGMRVGVCTDCGHVTPGIAEALTDCDLLGIESNHDPRMLEHGPYPWFLKRRIASVRGHLSNQQAGDALERVASDRLARVVGLHLSRTNNAPDVALASLKQGARRLGLKARVDIASQFEPLVCDLLMEDV